MQLRQGTNLTSLRGVQQFLDAHADQLAGVAASGQRRKLDQMVIELQNHAEQQAGHDVVFRGVVKSKRSLEEALRRDHMRPIARIAASESPGIPALQAFRMPRGGVSFEQLAELANGMAEAAQPYANEFVQAGLPPTFLDELRAASQALIQSSQQQKVTMGSRTGATRGLKQRTPATRKVVAALDALVRRATKDESLLASWDSVKHVRRSAIASTPSETPAATSAPTAPALAAA